MHGNKLYCTINEVSSASHKAGHRSVIYSQMMVIKHSRANKSKGARPAEPPSRDCWQGTGRPLSHPLRSCPGGQRAALLPCHTASAEKIHRESNSHQRPPAVTATSL